MIDFRYHLVSIVAVFLALAIGIIVGTSAVQPKVIGQLDNESRQVVRTNNKLTADNDQLRSQLNTEEKFVTSISGYVLSHKLAGERVAIVTAPGADSGTVSGITTAIQQAGAQVTGQVNLTQLFLDVSAATEAQLNLQASQVSPPGFTPGTTGQMSGQVAGQEAAAQLIAAAIAGRSGSTTFTTAEQHSILTGFGTAGFLQVAGPGGGPALSGPAELAVVVIPATAPQNASDPQNLALIAMANALQQTGDGTLLAGSWPGSGTGSAIDAITSGAAGVKLSTVDNANTEAGQIMTVIALRQLLNPHASPTAYGIVPNAVPSPIPTTSPTPSSTSASPNSSASGHKGKP